MGIDPLGDHVITYKQHTGSICGHNHLMDVLANLAHASNIGPVRVDHKVTTRLSSNMCTARGDWALHPEDLSQTTVHPTE